jgi:hypothetical protein
MNGPAMECRCKTPPLPDNLLRLPGSGGSMNSKELESSLSHNSYFNSCRLIFNFLAKLVPVLLI